MTGHMTTDITLHGLTWMQEHRRRVAAAQRRSTLDYGLWGIEPTPQSARDLRTLVGRLGRLLRRRGGRSLGHTTTRSTADA